MRWREEEMPCRAVQFLPENAKLLERLYRWRFARLAPHVGGLLWTDPDNVTLDSENHEVAAGTTDNAAGLFDVRRLAEIGRVEPRTHRERILREQEPVATAIEKRSGGRYGP